MPTADWQTISRIVATALEVPVQERAAFVAEACAGNEGLRREVEELLAADPERVAFLERAPLRLLETPLRTARPGDEIGAYRLLHELGSGGMGSVFLAERADDQFQRKVALKLLRSHVGSATAELRFRQEIEILARLDHPNIARLFDGGRTNDAQPYYLMEYVEGERIDRYCARKCLNLEQRIELFIKVCSAVQHAHGKLVVHRDLKPSNILVTSEGEPKLLDFGIANLLQASTSASSPATPSETVRPLTPAYASPEQFRNQPTTTASDVYTLGVLLYELLTGRLPYDLSGLTLDEKSELVCTREPAPPSSTALSPAPHHADASSTAESADEARQLPSVQVRALRGDVDSIVLKALRKEPEDRYHSVLELIEDLRRFLNGFPVTARRPHPLYRARKFIGRNLLPIAAGLLLLLGLASFALYRQQQQARLLVEQQKSEWIADFLTGMFDFADPAQANQGQVPVRVLVDEAADRLERTPSNELALQASLKRILGTIYVNLEIHDRAEPLLESAVNRLQETGSENASELAEALIALARLRFQQAAFEKAASIYDEAIAILRTLPDERETLASALSGRGDVDIGRGDITGAETLFQQALSIVASLPDGPHPEFWFIRNSVAALSLQAGRYKEAEAGFLEVLGDIEELYGAEHPAAAYPLNALGVIYRKTEQYEAAERMYQRALSIRRATFGEDSPLVARTVQNLAVLYRVTGRSDEAERLYLEALEIKKRTLGADHPSVGGTLHNLARHYKAEGLLDKAEASYRQALAILEDALGPRHPETARTLNNLGVLFIAQGRHLEAESVLLQAFDIRLSTLGEDHVDFAETLGNLGIAHAELGQLEKADQELRRAIDIASRAMGPEHRLVRNFTKSLEVLENRRNKPSL